uniref:Adenomatous polyposis coli N-terminal dimerisation domain-containing protein n=1 Tax=Hippocampus comes TaxID=109280 RepID=A0A3Q2Z901_HIPCM
MAAAAASYDQLAHQVAALRKENSHLRRELEDNSNHLCKLETETFGMKEVLKQLQCQLEQEAGTLASSGRGDVLRQAHLVLPISPFAGVRRLSDFSDDELKENTNEQLFIAHAASGRGFGTKGEEPVGSHESSALTPLSSLRRNQLLGEIDREERERCWYFSQLEPAVRDTRPSRLLQFSRQMDFIRQQLEFEVQQVRCVMEERFGSSEEMIHRTQVATCAIMKLSFEEEFRRAMNELGG